MDNSKLAAKRQSRPTWKTLIGIILFVLAGYLIVGAGLRIASRDNFVREFTDSLIDGTDLYKKYIRPENAYEPEATRKMLKRPYAITHRQEIFFLEGDEYVLKFANGAELGIDVHRSFFGPVDWVDAGIVLGPSRH